ncbi:MAG: bis(5'-nucleosyl)-tetraphosphatase (symmetrical) YqeK [Clostridia bacterium]|nr:bis(5'-nucleosyl)-tetraphosphatase (symmetrical) YqeK [Clostridia bacterium]
MVKYTEDYYLDILKKNLTEKRYHHCLCVRDEAVRLAKKYGADEKKAYWAGLLHDVTKDSDREYHFSVFEKYGYLPDELTKKEKKLWHAKSGALLLKNELGVTDDEIISAIDCHTTAKPNMTLLERVLYIADFTSSDRDYNGIEEIRAAADESLEAAMDIALTFTVTDLVERRKAVHPDTFNAYNDFVIKNERK